MAWIDSTDVSSLTSRQDSDGSFVTKVLDKLIRDRGYPSQEVCHSLLDLPLAGRQGMYADKAALDSKNLEGLRSRVYLCRHISHTDLEWVALRAELSVLRLKFAATHTTVMRNRYHQLRKAGRILPMTNCYCFHLVTAISSRCPSSAPNPSHTPESTSPDFGSIAMLHDYSTKAAIDGQDINGGDWNRSGRRRIVSILDRETGVWISWQTSRAADWINERSARIAAAF
ncbi:uncharacterized protein EI97DRAFT_473805 [Westerdykella ornata]|uniref:Uncharacterized protein n=1 Tax=Westerdykella ornata TaxID=318751 RepID=A0A6A6JJ27_WESOR|nr:uncharacterized protein EI97DRAFT_473805 [Westerdykella ornata]KAF2276601.1 hypothetical protein EI97DRAFT_473805 [Westerdykella ornata]